MELQTIPFEKKLVIICNNQEIHLTPFIIKDDSGTVKFGITAPRGVSIDREEIYKKKKEQLRKLSIEKQTP